LPSARSRTRKPIAAPLNRARAERHATPKKSNSDSLGALASLSRLQKLAHATYPDVVFAVTADPIPALVSTRFTNAETTNVLATFHFSNDVASIFTPCSRKAMLQGADAQDLIDIFCNLRACAGFSELPLYGLLRNREQYQNSRRSEDGKRLFAPACSGLCTGNSSGCDACQGHKRNLYKMARRAEDDGAKQRVQTGSRTNWRYLSDNEAAQRRATLTAQNVTLQRTVKQQKRKLQQTDEYVASLETENKQLHAANKMLKAKYEAVFATCQAHLSKRHMETLRKLLANLESKSKQVKTAFDTLLELAGNAEAKEFLMDQIVGWTHEQAGTRKQMEFSMVTMRLAVGIYCRAPTAYRALLDSKLLVLPSESLLEKRLRYTRLNAGLHAVDGERWKAAYQKFTDAQRTASQDEDEIEEYAEMTDEEKMNIDVEEGQEQDLDTALWPQGVATAAAAPYAKVPGTVRGVPLNEGLLIADELHASSGVTFTRNHQWVGTLDHAPLDNSMESAFKFASTGERPTSTQGVAYILQYVWRDLSCKFDLIGPYFISDRAFSEAELMQHQQAVETFLHQWGFTVRAAMMDGTSTNLAVFRALCTKGANKPTPRWYKTPYYESKYGHKIYVMIDPTHLMVRTMLSSNYV
jgi:hypothetical protein